MGLMLLFITSPLPLLRNESKSSLLRHSDPYFSTRYPQRFPRYGAFPTMATIIISSSSNPSFQKPPSRSKKLPPKSQRSNSSSAPYSSSIASNTIQSTSSSARRRVVICGSGWAGLAAANVLSSYAQYDVVVVEASPHLGGAITETISRRASTSQGQGLQSRLITENQIEASLQGFWFQYKNIANLCEQLGLSPFTQPDERGQYNPQGLQAIWPVLGKKSPKLPTPLGPFMHTKFISLKFIELATAFPMLFALGDFDNSHESWQKWDKISFRELCKQHGVSKMMYDNVLNPMCQTHLFTSGETCSAAAAMSMINFLILSHSEAFDVRFVRGSLYDNIFQPWIQAMIRRGVKFKPNHRVCDVILDEFQQNITHIKCANGEIFKADAVILCMGINGMQFLTRSSSLLAGKQEFSSFMSLKTVDAMSVTLWLDKRVQIPYSSNIFYGFDNNMAWTMYDLTKLHAPAFNAEAGSVIQADFYNASKWLPMTDNIITEKVKMYLDGCINAIRKSQVIDSSVIRLPNSLPQFFPGSYQHMPRKESKVFGNLYYAGNCLKDNQYGVWNQEKAFVTGVDAANSILAYFRSTAEPADIIKITDEGVPGRLLRSLRIFNF